VTKGRFSEGINFTDRLCRCLVVVGIPFLPLKNSAVVEKMRYI
jgi:Rad3-related DNA helicase